MSPQEYIQQCVDGEPILFDEARQQLSDRLGLLNELAQTPQDPLWHAEGNVAIHTRMVMESLESLLEETSIPLTEEKKLALRLAALFHDIAKPLTTREEERDGAVRILAPRHAMRGRSYLFYRLFGLLEPSLFFQVLSLVAHHHAPIQLTVREQARAQYHKLARKVDLPSLYLLSMADMKGRICEDQESQFDYVDLFQLTSEGHGLWQNERFLHDWTAPLLNATKDESLLCQEKILMESLWEFEAGNIQMPEEAIARSYTKRSSRLPQLVITCGVSGCGKSTWLAQQLPDHRVISLDALRENWTGTRTDQRQNARVLADARKALKDALRLGHKVAWDATNLRYEFRQALLGTGLDYGAHTTLALFCADLKTLAKRNRKRQNPIKKTVFEKQINGFSWPDIDEAHRTLYIDDNGRCVRDTRDALFSDSPSNEAPNERSTTRHALSDL